MVRAVFIHIPKTAGTSFRDALCRGFGEHAVSPIFIASHLTSHDAKQLSRYDIVCGHISLTDVERLFPDAALLTILREPIDRCVSWYNFAHGQEAQPHTDVTAAQKFNIDDFFALDKTVVFRNIFNRQTRQLGDHVLNEHVKMDNALAKAKETLRRCAWVGRYETLVEDLAKLGVIFPELAGIPLKELNVTDKRPPIREIAAQLQDKIMAHNQYDRRLYLDFAAFDH